MAQADKVPLGQVLVEKGFVEPAVVDTALDMQKRSGSRLGTVLVGEGKINFHHLHTALADQQHLPFVDLQETPCDPALLEAVDRERYGQLVALPWKKEGKTIIVAVSDMSTDVLAWAKQKYGTVEFVMTSPRDVFWTLQEQFSKEDDKAAREALWENTPEQSAKIVFSRPDLWNVFVVSGVLLTALLFFTHALAAVFVVVNLFYFCTLLFKLGIFVAGVAHEKQQKAAEHPAPVKESVLPIYTLLVPMFKEHAHTVAQLVTAIRKLDYPKSKLDVKLIVENGDEETIAHIKALAPENYFEIVRVPFSYPQTKPKACNYALLFAKGRYVTIYDAEDIPAPDQLKRVVECFSAAPPEVVCVQCKLNYYNRRENLLTRLFALEYSAWFDFMIPGLQAFDLPMPLGGTSNHFPTHILRELFAWDPYNVTEDADLGIRLAQKGYRTQVLDSLTLEEAPVTLGNWLRQRSRWIKGYIQTYIVHMRDTSRLFRKLGVKRFFGFQLFVGAPSLVYTTLPIMILISLVALVHAPFLPEGIVQLAVINFFFSVLLHIGFAVAVMAKHSWWKMAPYCLAFPFYWLLHSIASFKSVAQLITRPHFWEKTEHGVSKVNPHAP